MLCIGPRILYIHMYTIQVGQIKSDLNISQSTCSSPCCFKMISSMADVVGVSPPSILPVASWTGKQPANLLSPPAAQLAAQPIWSPL